MSTEKFIAVARGVIATSLAAQMASSACTPRPVSGQDVLSTPTPMTETWTPTPIPELKTTSVPTLEPTKAPTPIPEFPRGVDGKYLPAPEVFANLGLGNVLGIEQTDPKNPVFSKIVSEAEKQLKITTGNLNLTGFDIVAEKGEKLYVLVSDREKGILYSVFSTDKNGFYVPADKGENTVFLQMTTVWHPSTKEIICGFKIGEGVLLPPTFIYNIDTKEIDFIDLNNLDNKTKIPQIGAAKLASIITDPTRLPPPDTLPQGAIQLKYDTEGKVWQAVDLSGKIVTVSDPKKENRWMTEDECKLYEETKIDSILNFTGQLKTSTGEVVGDFPITIKIAKNLAMRNENPIKEVALNTESRYKEGLPLMAMELFFLRWKVENPTSKLSLDDFIKQQPGLKLALNSSESSWGTKKDLNPVIKTIFPKSLEIILTDKVFGEISKDAFYIATNDTGGIKIAWPVESYYSKSLLKNENNILTKGLKPFFLIQNVTSLIYWVDNKQILNTKGVMSKKNSVNSFNELKSKEEGVYCSQRMQWGEDRVCDPKGRIDLSKAETYFLSLY